MSWSMGKPITTNRTRAGAVAVLHAEGAMTGPGLRNHADTSLDEDIQFHFERKGIPHVSDAWIDREKTKVGYEIPFTRHFYVYTPPRPLAEIDEELRELEAQIQKLLGEVTE